MEMLKISDLNVSYGAIHAIHDVAMSVHKGELVSLIGANGAGRMRLKSTHQCVEFTFQLGIAHTLTGCASAFWARVV